MARARALVRGDAAGEDVSGEALRHAKRIMKLAVTVQLDLERAQAPWHVFRWVACARNMTEQDQRRHLVLHLHKHLPRRRDGWLQEPQVAAAFRWWLQAREAKRKKGGIMPMVHEIPLEDYVCAIESARRGPSTPRDEPVNLAAELDDQEHTDEQELPPAMTGRETTAGRDRVLHHLAMAVKAALAERDIEAAEAAADALVRLVEPAATVEPAAVPTTTATTPTDTTKPNERGEPAVSQP
jgi:hypothetical protein